MRLIHFDLAGQKQTFEIYDSEEEFDTVNAEIERIFGKPVVNPQINICEIKPNKFI